VESLNLPLARYRLQCVADEDFQLPAYTGSAWRGLFGHALKAAVCVTGKPACEGCLLYRNCVYSYVFETPPPADAQMMRKYPSVPHPFVLTPAQGQATELTKGDALSVELMLVGQSNQHLPYLVHSFEQAGKRGLGSAQGHFSVQSVLQWQGDDQWLPVYAAGGSLNAQPPVHPACPPCPQGEVRLAFLTPLRMRLQNREVTAASFDFYALLSVLMRRVSMLQQFHTDQPLELDFKALSAQARTVGLLRNSLFWQDWTRYSSRQKTPVKMGGLMGEVVLDGKALQAFWPLLWLGQYVHAGKGTSMGLGAYQLSQLSA